MQNPLLMIKKHLSFAVAAVAAAAALSVSCNDDDCALPSIPTVGLVTGTVSATSIGFTVTADNADKIAYVCLEKSDGTAALSAEEILESGKSAESGRTVEISGLKPETVYIIGAAASNSSATSGTVSTEVTTAGVGTLPTEAPEVVLEAAETERASLSFIISFPENADACAYVWLEKTTGTVVPNAVGILSGGTEAAEPGRITVGGLKPGTAYVIASAAVRDGIYGKVARIEMTTEAAPAPSVVLTPGTTSPTALSFDAEFTDAENCAYVCIEKTEESTVPGAAEILDGGTAIDRPGEVAVSGLKPNTAYIIAAAASAEGSLSEAVSIEMSTDISFDGPAVFDRVADAAYYGDSAKTGYGEFRFTLADGETREADGVTVTSGAGRAMTFDLWGMLVYDPATSIILPARTYRLGDRNTLNTFDPSKTYCMTNDGKGNTNKVAFTGGTITVAMSGFTYTVTADLTTSDGNAFTASYEGRIEFRNEAAPDTTIPSVDADVTDLDLVCGIGSYYGEDSDRNGLAMFEIHLYTVQVDPEKDYLLGEGYKVSLEMTSALSPGMQIEEGVYTVSKSYGRGTLYPGSAQEFMGTVLAMGTHVEKRTARYESFYGMANSGTVTVTKSGSGYKMEINLMQQGGYRLTGTFDGPLIMKDKS